MFMFCEIMLPKWRSVLLLLRHIAYLESEKANTYVCKSVYILDCNVTNDSHMDQSKTHLPSKNENVFPWTFNYYVFIKLV